MGGRFIRHLRLRSDRQPGGGAPAPAIDAATADTIVADDRSRLTRWLPETVCLAVRYGGLAVLVRATVARRKATILVYHDPPVALLERHLDYLSKRYAFVPLDRLVDAIRAQDWTEIPAKSLVVTLDDGHRGNAALLPLFVRYDVCPTIFLCSQIANTNRSFWFFVPPDPEGLKRLPNDQRLVYLEQEWGFSPTRESSSNGRQALDAEEIALMKESVDFASHTRFHPILTTCSTEECEEEIVRSKGEVEQLTNAPCRNFSYPNGDYAEREVELARRAGYASARTMDFGWNDIRTDPFKLKVLPIRDDASVNRLVADLCGVAGYLGNLRRRMFPPRAR